MAISVPIMTYVDVPPIRVHVPSMKLTSASLAFPLENKRFLGNVHKQLLQKGGCICFKRKYILLSEAHACTHIDSDIAQVWW